MTAAENTVDGKAVVEKLDPITGTVSGKDGDSIRIGSDWYDKAAGANTVPNNKDDVEAIVYNGYYFDIDNASTDLDLAVVIGIGTYNKMDKVLPVKLMLQDGSEEVVNVEKWFTDTTEKTEKDLTTLDTVNVMVSYTIDDDYYSLTPVEDGKQIAKSDYDGALPKAAEYDKDKAAVIIDNAELDVADDAFIVIYDGDDYTCMTGADLLKKNAFVFGDDLQIYAAVKDGKEVGALFGFYGDSLSSGDEMYAYIISADTQVNADNKDRVYLDVVIDGEKKTDVETNKDATKLADYSKPGTVIQYTMDGEVMNIEKDVTKDVASGAIKEFNDSRVLMRDGARLLLTKDTTIITFDSDDDYAYVSNTLYEAPAATVDDKGAAATYFENAYYIANKDKEIEVIFVDIFAPDVK